MSAGDDAYLCAEELRAPRYRASPWMLDLASVAVRFAAVVSAERMVTVQRAILNV